MPTSSVIYLGDLRTSSTHLQSGTTIVTDAPLDNNELNIDFSNSTAEVTKIMAAEPRRISEIHITFQMNLEVDEKTRIILERVALTCPVYHSLHPKIKKVLVFNWK